MPKKTYYSPLLWEQRKKKDEEYRKTRIRKRSTNTKPESVIRSKFSEGAWLSKKLYYTYY